MEIAFPKTTSFIWKSIYRQEWSNFLMCEQILLDGEKTIKLLSLIVFRSNVRYLSDRYEIACTLWERKRRRESFRCCRTTDTDSVCLDDILLRFSVGRWKLLKISFPQLFLVSHFFTFHKEFLIRSFKFWRVGVIWHVYITYLVTRPINIITSLCALANDQLEAVAEAIF